MLRTSANGGSDPVTRRAALLWRLRTGTPPRPSSGMIHAQSGDWACTATWSSSFHWMSRPARVPPACRLVRLAQMIMMSLPNCSATLAWPARSPSPAATISVMDTMPHAMPTIVRAVRSLCAESVWTVSRRRSRRSILLQDYLVAGLQAFEHLGLHAVGDPDLDRDLAAAVLALRFRHLHRGLALLVIEDGGVGDQEHVLLLLADDLGVCAHVRLQLAAGVLDGDAHLEGGDVVLLLAERRDLRHLAHELLVLERLDRDPGLLAHVHLADVGLVHLAEHVDAGDVAEGHDEGRLGAEDEDRADGVAHLHVAGEDEARHRAHDRRVAQVRVGPLERGPRARHLRLVHREVAVGGPLLVEGQLVLLLRVLEDVGRDEPLLVEPPGAFHRRPQERDVGPLGLHPGALEGGLR